MKGKTHAIITIVLMGGVLGALTLWDFFVPDRLFSSYENRILTQKPTFSIETLFDGSYTTDYESYVTDQFAGRDGWITVKTLTDVALGKKEVNGVYLAKDGSFIEKHDPEDITAEMEEKKLRWLEELAALQAEREGTFWVLLAPTADNVLTEKLPDYAVYYRQDAFLEQVKKLLGEEAVIDVTQTLAAHKDEYIYYRTDHHWTTLGAYYAYQDWAKAGGVTAVPYETKIISEKFLGTLHSKINLPMPRAWDGLGENSDGRDQAFWREWISGYAADVIEAWQSQTLDDLEVYYDLSEKPVNSIYEDKHLETKNQYGYFLDDNHALVRIENRNPAEDAAGKSIVVIKDSFANCFVPLLTAHYETIYVVDLRYYNAPIATFLQECGDGDLLVLYNVIHFLL